MLVLNTIVVDHALSKKRKQEVTLIGTVFIPMEMPVPVVVKGYGCVGIGIVTEIRMTSNSTKILFDLETSISESSKKAYYDLYRNQASQMVNTEDPYDNDDVIIPGAINSVKNNSSVKKKQSDENTYHWSDESRSRKSKGLTDYLDGFLDY